MREEEEVLAFLLVAMLIVGIFASTAYAIIREQKQRNSAETQSDTPDCACSCECGFAEDYR